jgi:hypothetical protein
LEYTKAGDQSDSVQNRTPDTPYFALAPNRITKRSPHQKLNGAFGTGRAVLLPADVCFGAHYGLNSDIALGPKSATSGLLHRNETRTQPITLSVRASTIGSVEPCYSLRIARRFIRLVL